MALEDIEKLKAKVKKDPNSKLFVPLAEEYRKTGMLDDAISVLMTGITSQPGYTSARVSLGKIYLEKKMSPAAKEEFEKVISAIPDNLFAHKKLAEIYRDSGEKERAIGEYRVVLKLNPFDGDAVSNLETLQKGHVQEESKTAPEPPTEEFTVQGNAAPYDAVEPSTQTAGEETIKAEEEGEQDTAQPPSSFEVFKEDKGAYSLNDAEQFISIGDYIKAMSIYKEMLSANPQNQYVMQKVEELRMLLKILGKDKEAVIDKLETFGKRLKENKDEFFRSSLRPQFLK
ncbi:MAG: hypothetical protein L6246_05420 [Thermodesulfovibrionales bacterium]|nr:hypothetical protein [Thermodesulfovibrionales bacterium]